MDLSSLELGVLRLCLPEHRNVRVGVLPQREELLVRSLRLGLFARQRVRPSQLQIRQRANRIVGNDSVMVDDFLKFGGSIGTPSFG